MKKLGEVSGKSNNLQLLRFIAAIMVIMSHAFSVSVGNPSHEWFMILTKNQITMGSFAVSIFFCAGGYLIAKSVCRTKTFCEYFRARILRIFPLLIVVVGISMFVLGPIMTNMNLKEYMSDSGLYKYALNAVLLPVHSLPGVFENNIYGTTVNGALWTLPIEFLCYVGCFIMYKLKMLEKKNFPISILIIAFGCSGIYYLATGLNVEILIAAIRPGILFYIGILYYVYRDNIILNLKVAILSVIGIAVLGFAGKLNYAMILCFPYLLIYICFGVKQINSRIGEVGRFSYGIYLCGFPIQQTIVAVAGGKMNAYLNMIFAIPIAVAVSVVLQKFEK